MTENDLYDHIAQWLCLQYPSVLFHFDLSGLWTPSHKARNLYGRLNSRAWPDLFIAAARGPYHGLFIEIKREGVVLYKQDGTLRAVTHHYEQAEMLRRLQEAGYSATFAVGFDEVTNAIRTYLSLPEK